MMMREVYSGVSFMYSLGMLHSINREDLRHRAACSASLLPRPFLRWAGSKRWLLPQLIDLLPPSFNKYYEPFLGSGA